VALRFGYVLAVLGSAVVLSGQPGTSEESVSCGGHSLDTDWSLEAPADAGFDPAVLCALTDYDYPLFKEHETNVHAIVVAREGKLVFESYRTGEDQTLGDIDLGVVTHAPDLPHDVRSVTKSVVSLLVGIAIDRELIVGVHAPVFSYFPEYAGLAQGKDGITLQHLLTMTSGLAWNETDYPYPHPSNTYRQMADSDEPYRYVLGQAVASPPGKRWTYSSGDTALLGAVLQKVSGQSLEEFARELLFEPLGITATNPSLDSQTHAGPPAVGKYVRPLRPL
jgi:CubicO group peptidase (beta-lactamase class C family)